MRTEGADALARCVGDVERFARESWARRPFIHRDEDGRFDDLLTLSDVDHMLATMSLRTPAFRLVKDGSGLDPATYTKPARTGSVTITGVADPPRIFRLFEEGATIVLQGMHRYWPPIAAFCRHLELALGHAVQVNGYVTPPGSRGLAVHHDSHDVFVLQAFGRKSWEVYEPGRETEGPALAVTLEPGDSLYLPKGTPHAARTQEGASGHLTVGILSSTWGQLFRGLIERVGDQAEFDEPLPVGFHRDPEGFRALVEERLHDFKAWLDKADPGDLADRAIHTFLTSRPPQIEGALEALLTLESITDESVLRRRPGSICEVRQQGDRLRILLGDRELDAPAWLMPAFSLIAERAQFAVRDLEGHLDQQSRLVLARRLIREGLLELHRSTG